MNSFNHQRRAFLTLGGGALIHPDSVWSAMDRSINIRLAINDERGHPVPHATVWAYVLPRANPLALDSQDLRRLALRYFGTSEFVTPNNKIVPQQLVLPMGDELGEMNWNLNYQWLEGLDGRRPGTIAAGFAVLKRGYMPAFHDLAIADESVVEAVIALKRDTNPSVMLPAYAKDFDRLRFELSTARSNEAISEAIQQRVEGLRSSLQGVADQATAAGDRSTAARIYARMQYLPVVRFVHGRPAGLAQADPYSEQSSGYLARGYELDPSNPYIAAKRLFREGAERFGGRRYDRLTASVAQREAFSSFLAEIDRLMSEKGSQIWPAFHQLFALWLLKASEQKDRDRVTPLLEKLYRDEPKFQTRAQLLELPI